VEPDHVLKVVVGVEVDSPTEIGRTVGRIRSALFSVVVSVFLLMYCVERGLPFTKTDVVCVKLEPYTVIAAFGAPAIALDGEAEVTTGARLASDVSAQPIISTVAKSPKMMMLTRLIICPPSLDFGKNEGLTDPRQQRGEIRNA
jgi:hypothetical protein